MHNLAFHFAGNDKKNEKHTPAEKRKYPIHNIFQYFVNKKL
jgi:hypothetical protein